MPPSRPLGNSPGLRAILYLTLLNEGEVSDSGGGATIKLWSKIGGRGGVVPSCLSMALTTLKGKGLIDSDRDGSRTYAFWAIPDSLPDDWPAMYEQARVIAGEYGLRLPQQPSQTGIEPDEVSVDIDASLDSGSIDSLREALTRALRRNDELARDNRQLRIELEAVKAAADSSRPAAVVSIGR